MKEYILFYIEIFYIEKSHYRNENWFLKNSKGELAYQRWSQNITEAELMSLPDIKKLYKGYCLDYPQVKFIYVKLQNYDCYLNML